MQAGDHVELARFMNMDLVTLGYVSRVPNTSTYDAFGRMVLKRHDEFLDKVDDYIEQLKSEGELGLNVYIHGPFDSTYLSMGYEQFFYNCCDDLRFVGEMMDVFTADAIEMARELLTRNITTIEIVDDIAYKNGLFVRPKLFGEFWLPRMRQIVEVIHATGKPLFFHSDGDVGHFIELLIELGIMGVNPIEPACNDIAEIKKEYGKDIVLMGNFGIGGILAEKTPEEVAEYTRKLLATMMVDGAYVAMSSSSVTDGVEPDNYMAMVQTVLECGQY